MVCPRKREMIKTEFRRARASGLRLQIGLERYQRSEGARNFEGELKTYA